MPSIAPSLPFERAYLEDTGHHRKPHEERLVQQECERLGIPFEYYTAKRIQRRQLPLSARTFICGDMNSMHGALKQLGIPVPECHDFPDCLSPWFHRRIWRSTLGAVEHAVYESGPDVFAKPAGRRKVFTGRVFSTSCDFEFVNGVSRREPVWCSDVVKWLSEYRVYVIGAEIKAVDHYDGDPAEKLDLASVNEAIRCHHASGTAPAAYGIDFGVLSTGETALVEANDGYALGAYQIDAATYTEVLFTRWQELVRLIPNKGSPRTVDDRK